MAPEESGWKRNYTEEPKMIPVEDIMGQAAFEMELEELAGLN